MFARQSLVVFALSSLTAVAAQAEVVEVTWDVTALTRSVGSTVGGVYGEQVDTSFQPQTFSYTVSFDLNSAVINPPAPFAVTDPGAPYPSGVATSGWFDLLTHSATPFTPGLLASAPDRQSALFDANFAGYSLSAPDTSTISAPEPVLQESRVGTFALWSMATGTTSYSRGVSFQTMGNPVAAQELQAWTPAEYVAYLQSHTGEVLSGAFVEAYDFNSQSVFVIGTPLPSVNQHDSITITGDAVIRSVSVVPEPATYALMGVGLSLMAWVRRRQTV